MSSCILIPIITPLIIALSLTAMIWRVTRNASSAEDKQETLAALFGGWPPTKENAILLVVFFGSLVLLSWWVCTSR
jgi:hypothetical protein